MYLDMKFWLPYDILLKADKMTMANSLEVRVPFCDKDLVEFLYNVPFSYKYNENIEKNEFEKNSTRKVIRQKVIDTYTKKETV